MPDLYLYSTPPGADVQLTLDTGETFTGVPCTANGRSDAYRVSLPDGTPTQGGLVTMSAPGYFTQSGRGIVEMDNSPCFIHDDWHLQAIPPPPPEPPPPDPNVDPFPICEAVYHQGDFDLGTKEGCGEYTEACVEALHAQQSFMWGHIRKTTAQNNWNGHAVDAIMLLAKAGGTDAGIYDIVWSTESPEAKPAWSYKGGPDPNLWYYGPMPCPPV